MMSIHYILWGLYALIFIMAGALFEGLVDYTKQQALTNAEMHIMMQLPVAMLGEIKIENL